MKAAIISAIALLAAGLGTGCKNTNSESTFDTDTSYQDTTDQDTTTSAKNPTDGINPGISAEDPERPSSTSGTSGSTNTANGGNGTSSLGGSQPNGENGNGSELRFSGDGSDGRTYSSSVNKAKAVQVRNRTNAYANDKGNYSAPDGTRAENFDGDMYTKHDTTRMPSGATPIK